MKIRNLLSSLILASVIAAPVLISNTAQASDRCDNGYARYNDYKHGYYNGYRESKHRERRHRRHHRKHHDYRHDYRPYRTHGHKHRRHGHRTGIDLIFRF